ncbi:MULTISPECIES: DUF3012 domain-containing protein [unclassified Thioalkalivibrio]|uniref:DUF3012 domain-containing protein n=1 Tax=unclassified Thioalkalivibrio TaxID=2621013 RepID=UPI00037C222E|nr:MULTISPECIES: DUF3012 domain-containing protein [unclassified Thioalkalivibrio]
MSIPKWLALAALMTLLPLGCGSDPSADADGGAAPVAAERPAVDARRVEERVVQNLHDQAALFEEIGDRLQAIDGQPAADELGRRLAEEYTARTVAQMDEMIAWAETHLASLDTAERAVLDQEVEALLAESGRLEAAGMRFDRATERVGQQLESLMMRNPEQGQVVLDGMIEFGASVEAVMQDERVVALDRLMAPEPTPVEAAPAGTPAWCERMANTPQAQWTMNDAFAFANHCTGG